MSKQISTDFFISPLLFPSSSESPNSAVFLFCPQWPCQYTHPLKHFSASLGHFILIAKHRNLVYTFKSTLPTHGLITQKQQRSKRQWGQVGNLITVRPHWIFLLLCAKRWVRFLKHSPPVSFIKDHLSLSFSVTLPPSTNLYLFSFTVFLQFSFLQLLQQAYSQNLEYFPPPFHSIVISHIALED